MADRKLVPVTYSACGHTDQVRQGTRPPRCSKGCDPVRPQHRDPWTGRRG